MAKATKKAAASTADSSAEFLDSLNELNKLANRTDLTKLQARSVSKGGGKARGAAVKGAVGAEAVDVCGVYGKVRPFLDIIIRIPFIPAKAKDAIKLLMSVLDTICPR